MTAVIPDGRRTLVRAGVVGLGAALAFGICLAVLQFGGSIRAAQLDAFGIDIGATPWLLPLTRLAGQLAAVGAVGGLVAAAFLVPGERTSGEHGRLVVAVRARAWLTGAALAAAGWALATSFTMCLTLSDLLAIPVGEAVSWGGLKMLTTSLDQGRGLALTLALAVVVAVAALRVRSVTGIAVVAVLAIVATLPPAFGGHAAGSANHQLAVSTLMAHIGGAVLWTGGLLALLLSRRQAGPALARSVGRFSRLALCCFIAVSLTGLASVTLRLSQWSDLGTAYGVVALLKLAALTVLGVFGWWHRRASIPALAAGRRGAFGRLAAVEVLIMAAAFGLAAGLARTPAPDGAREADFVQTPIRTALNWLPDPLFFALAVSAIGCYLVGVRRLRRRGDPWPLTRTAAWIAGWLTVALATDLELARAGQGTFLMMEKVQHVALGVVAPILLVSGGGIALAREVWRPTTEEGMRGPREWLIAVLDARATRLLTHPAAAVALYAVALYGLYASALYTLTLRSHAGHLLTFAGALLIGGLYYWPLLGVHPAPSALPHQSRLAQLLAATLLQAVFGIALARSAPLGTHTVTWIGISVLLIGATWLAHRADTDPEPTDAEDEEEDPADVVEAPKPAAAGLPG